MGGDIRGVKEEVGWLPFSFILFFFFFEKPMPLGTEEKTVSGPTLIPQAITNKRVVKVNPGLMSVATGYEKQLSPTICAQAARCYLLCADAHYRYSRNNKSDESYVYWINKSIAAIQKYEKYVKCGIERINKKCKNLLTSCTDDFKFRAVTLLGFSEKLVYDCDIYTFSYTLFLCKNIRNWPTEVTIKFPKGLTNCESGCNKIAQYDVFHKFRGVKKFPPNWQDQILEQERLDKIVVVG